MWAVWKKTNVLVWIMVGICFWVGCGKEDETDSIIDNKTSLQTNSEYRFLPEEELEWKDNSLDTWQAVFNVPIKSIVMEGSDPGTTHYFADENGAVSYRSQRVISTDEFYNTISRTSQSGETVVQNIENEPEYAKGLFQNLGPIAGEAGYVAYRTEMDKSFNFQKLRFFTMNENYEITNAFERSTPFYQPVASIAGDSKGNYHVIRTGGGTFDIYYTVLDPNGETLVDAAIPNSALASLSTLKDGSILACVTGVDDKGRMSDWHIMKADPDNGTIKEVAAIKQKSIPSKVCEATPKNENETVFCGLDGLYLYSSKDESVECIYKWENHGITMNRVRSFYAQEDGTISIIYDEVDEGVQYLLLKPIFEERPVQKITFAISKTNSETFRSAITAFNKKYPTYSIEMKSDYDNTALLTQLGAGEGPVLIDTELTGFEPLQKLWQPLDGFLEQSGLADALLPEALSFGAIGDSTYGVVTDFVIDTLITRNQEIADWDYDAYLDAVENYNGAIFTSTGLLAPSDIAFNFFWYLNNGLEDNAYINMEDRSIVFGTPKFRRMLKIAESGKQCIPTDENGTVLTEGRALCEDVYLYNVAGLVKLRMRLEDSETYAVGCPTKDGARHLLRGAHPITIRSTATEEEKQIAYTFLQVLLSYENALSVARNPVYSGGFSVRKDILKEQFNFYDERMEYTDNPELDEQKENALFRELLANSTVRKSFPGTLQGMFDEELDAYLEGEIPGDLLDSRLKSRVSLFLDENE